MDYLCNFPSYLLNQSSQYDVTVNCLTNYHNKINRLNFNLSYYNCDLYGFRIDHFVSQVVDQSCIIGGFINLRIDIGYNVNGSGSIDDCKNESLNCYDLVFITFVIV